MDNSNSRRNFVKGVAAAGAVCLLGSRTLASSSTQTQPGLADMEVRAALAKFVHAFDDLGWEGFRLAFDDSATVFYPRAFPERANGRAEFENNFKMVFQQIRGAKTVTPFMDIRPMDMRIQIFGDIAIATFHLDDRAGFLNRRTIALSKSIASWKIVHLHASEVATNDEHR
jgi:ketosteroid isomerase-like protein